MDVFNAVMGYVNGLKEKLLALGLSANDRKATLQDRLCEHFGLTVDAEEDSSNSETSSVQTTCCLRSSLCAISRNLFKLLVVRGNTQSRSGSMILNLMPWT
ncbi:PREDICTED: uncharacterized protein LOC108971711 [Bactrocera latifrons]|uniref:uncharacterized protein LOC108971711 n=1 Tax=Bactrocera latifrons TaxID=174628 RepID=UPI0008DE984F|nr:PREDICTED: uncharacterized protein LOC108971711 [Bactrocera latifrons]